MLKYEHKRKRYLPYFACFSSGLFSFYSLFQLSLVNTISQNLMTSFHLTYLQMGIFSAVFILTNTVWLILGGLLLDKYSARVLAMLFILLSALANFVLAKSHWLPLSIIMRAVQGTASAMSLLIYARIVPSWFAERPATALGLIGILASLGGIFANTVFIQWVTLFNWREALVMDGLIGLLFFLIMYIFLYEKESQRIKPYCNQKSVFHEMKVVVANLQNTIYGLYIGFITLPIFLLTSLWGMLYLTHVWQLTDNTASKICALIFLGNILGEPSVGFISDKYQSRKTIVLIGTLLSLMCMLILLLVKSLTTVGLAVVFFGMGYFSSTQIIYYINIRKSNHPYRVSTATSYVLFIMNIVGIIMQPVSGFVIGSHQITADYQHLLMVIVVSFIICLLLGFCTNTKEVYANN